MANTKTAKKSIRVTERRRRVNRARQGRIRTFIKSIESAIEEKEHKKAMEAFKTAQPVIQAGENKKVHSKTKVSRTLKRLNSRILDLVKK